MHDASYGAFTAASFSAGKITLEPCRLQPGKPSIRSTNKRCYAAFRATFTTIGVVICAVLEKAGLCAPIFTTFLASMDTIYRSWLLESISDYSARAISALTLILFGVCSILVDFSHFFAIVRVVVNSMHICLQYHPPAPESPKQKAEFATKR